MADVSLLVIYVVANFTVAYASTRSLPAHLTGAEYADVEDEGEAKNLTLIDIISIRALQPPSCSSRDVSSTPHSVSSCDVLKFNASTTRRHPYAVIRFFIPAPLLRKCTGCEDAVPFKGMATGCPSIAAQ